VGAYARYKCPYVWVRSSHQRLHSSNVDPRLKGSLTKDAPLSLNSTNLWKTQPIKVWDIIAELVSLTIPVTPNANPFQIDRHQIEKLSPLEGSLAAAALATFLKKLYLTNEPYAEAILPDLEWALSFHFSALPSPTKSIPKVENHSETSIPFEYLHSWMDFLYKKNPNHFGGSMFRQSALFFLLFHVF